MLNVIWAGIIDREKCGRKIAAENVWQKNYGRKTAVEKLQQKKCGKKIAVEKSQQWIRSNKIRTTECYKKRYGSHMCSVEFMNQVEGLPCKYVGFPLGSLWLVVELI